jgi:uncharacterized protein YcbX
MTPSVVGLAFTPVKGTRLRPVDRLEIGRAGPTGDRRFYVVDDRDRMVNGKTVGELTAVVASVEGDTLSMAFPDGTVVAGTVNGGEPITARFYSLMREDRVVAGPWAQALSEHAGQALRLVEAMGGRSAIDRGGQGGVSIISRASLDRLAAEAEEPEVDVRRFRMTVEIGGVQAHAEDAWVGRRVRVGSALMRVRGHVGRCLITSRDPETGVIDLPTLDILAGYRGNTDTTEPLPFGVYGEVLEPGAVALGDPVALAD